MANTTNENIKYKTSEPVNNIIPIPPVRKNKLAKRSKSLLDEINEVIEERARDTTTKSLTMDSDTTESDFSDLDHNMFANRNLHSPPLRPNPDKISVGLRANLDHVTPIADSQQTKSPSPKYIRSPARKQRQYIVNPDDSDTISSVRQYHPLSLQQSSTDSYITQNANLTTDSSSYESTTTDTESEIASPVRNSVYGLRYRKIQNDDTDAKSDEEVLSDTDTLEQLMLHRLPGENLGMILGVEAGKKGSSKVRKVIVQSVTAGGAAHRATGGTHGIRIGDEIVEVNRKVLSSLTHDECVSVFHEMPLRLLLSVKRPHGRNSKGSSRAHERLGASKSWPYYNGYQTETSESETEGNYPPGFRQKEIKISKTSKENLGISIVPSYGSTREYYQVKRLLASGVCAKNQDICVGDRLVACNGQSLKGVTQNECLNILKTAGNELKLTVLSQDKFAYSRMDTNVTTDLDLLVNSDSSKNGDVKQISDQHLSTSETNANVLFAQKNVKLAFTPPYVSNQITTDSDSSVMSSPSKETQSVVSEVDQHILDLTGAGLDSAKNGITDVAENNTDSVDTSLLDSIPPPLEFSDDHISTEESETSTLTDPGDSSTPRTNLDDLLSASNSDDTATNTPVHTTNTPVHTTSTPVHNVSNTISESFPDNDELLIVQSSGTRDGNTNFFVQNNQAIPFTVIDDILTESDSSYSSQDNILNFNTRVSNVIEGGKPTTLFDIDVKSVSNDHRVRECTNIDDLLFSVQTNEQESSLKSPVEINNQVVENEKIVSPKASVSNSKQTDEENCSIDDNVTAVQVGLISLDPNNIVDEGMVTKVSLVDDNDNINENKSQPQGPQVTNIIVNKTAQVSKLDVGYEHSNSLHNSQNQEQMPGSVIFSVDEDIRETNTACITVNNPSPPIPSPRLSPQVASTNHISKSETVSETITEQSDVSKIQSSPKPLPRKSQQTSKTTVPTLNTAKLVDAVQPSATILVNTVEPTGSKPEDVTLEPNVVIENNSKPVDSIPESKPVLIHDSNQNSEIANVTEPKARKPRLKSSKQERSDRSNRILITSYQSTAKTSGKIEDDELFQPMKFVQDEQGNRSCVPTPPQTPKRQAKIRDEAATKDLTDILLRLVNIGSGVETEKSKLSSNVSVEEGVIEPKKVSRETVETVLDAFSKLIPKLDKDPKKKSIFQKAVSNVIEDIEDDDNNNVPKDKTNKESLESKVIEKKEIKPEEIKEDIKFKSQIDEQNKLHNIIDTVSNKTSIQSSQDTVSNKTSIQSSQDIVSNKTSIQSSQPLKLDEVDNREYNKIISNQIFDNSQTVSVGKHPANVADLVKKQEIVKQNEKPVDNVQNSEYIKHASLKQNKSTDISQVSNTRKEAVKEALKPAKSLDHKSAQPIAPKKLSTSPHITTIRTQPYSSIKSSLTSFTTKAPKADYSKTRCEDRPFQVDVLKGIAGLGIKLAVGKDSLAQITNIQSSGPVAKNGQVRVGDYVLSINSTVLTGQSDSKVQQILRLLPRGLSKIVISTKPPDASIDKTVPLTIDTDISTDNSMELSPSSPSTGFTKYGVRLSPKPFSSLSSSPKSSPSEGLAPIKERRYSPVAAPTYRKVSVDKTADIPNGATNVEFPFDKDAPAINGGAKSVPFPFDRTDNTSDKTSSSSSSDKVNNLQSPDNKNGLSDELAIKTNSSLGSTPSSLSPALSPALSPRSDEVDSAGSSSDLVTEKAQLPKKTESSKVHATQIYVNKSQTTPTQKVVIPKSYAENKIIAATWGKDTGDSIAPPPKSSKGPPPVAPKPKSRAAKPVPELPKSSETVLSAPMPVTRQKSPGAETLKLTDKLKKFETEIQRQSDLAKPTAPIISRRTSSSSEHSTASLRSTSPDRDVFHDDRKSSVTDKHSPQMVFSTTVSPRGNLPDNQDRSYSMKISNSQNSMEITQTEVRKQSTGEQPQAPKRKTSSSSNPSPLSPNSPFYQDLTEKPVKINPVRLNRALAPKGSVQNQNVEIKSSVKLTSPTALSPEIKPTQKPGSWFAGKESETSTSNSECISPPPHVPSTEPCLVYQSPVKSPKHTKSKSPRDSMKSPEHAPSYGSDSQINNVSDNRSPMPGVKLEYESPKNALSEQSRRLSEEEIESKFDDLLNMQADTHKVDNITELNESSGIETAKQVMIEDIGHKQPQVNQNAPTESEKVPDNFIETKEISVAQVEDTKLTQQFQTEVKEPQNVVDETQLEIENLKVYHKEPIPETEALIKEPENSAEMLSESDVEPFAAALVEKVIDSARESMITMSNESEQFESKPCNGESYDGMEKMEDTITPVDETIVQQSLSSLNTTPDLINDVKSEDTEANKKNDKTVEEPVLSAPKELCVESIPPAVVSDNERSPSPPPLPSSLPPPLPSSPPPMTAKNPPDLVDIISGTAPNFTMEKDIGVSEPDVIEESWKTPYIPEEVIQSENVTDVAAVPNLIEDITAPVLPDVTKDHASAIGDHVNNKSESSALIEQNESSIQDLGTSVDPPIVPRTETVVNTACKTQHENKNIELETVCDEPQDLNVTVTQSTDIDVVKDTKNTLLDSNENLFSAKPVIISSVESQSMEPNNDNELTTSSQSQVSSFQESLPKTDMTDGANKAHIYSSTPAKGLSTPQVIAKDIDIDASDVSNNGTLLDTSEYVNISITSDGPDVTNEALKLSNNSISKRKWTFLSADKDTSVIEGKANASFEFMDFSNISLIEPEDLKKLVDLANQTMDRTGLSSNDQIIVALLHRDQPTDKVGLELNKGSQGKAIVSGLTANCLAKSDGKVKITDCLLSVNGKSVEERSVADIQEAIETPCSTVILVLSRGDNSTKTLPLSPPKDEAAKSPASVGTPTTPTTPTFTFNSADYASGETHAVTMTKGATGVGFCLTGGIGSPQGDMPIIIKRIFKGGPAEKCGQLQVKDQILQVNDLDFSSMRHYEAWNHLKYLPDGEVKMVIRRVAE